MTFMHRSKYFIDSKIAFIFFIYSYYVCARAQLINQHVDAGQLNVPP